MLRAMMGRLVQALVVVMLVVTLCFVLVRWAPGDPFLAALDEPGVSAMQRERLNAAFGYDRPILAQYLSWLGNLSRGELGHSHSLGRPVAEALGAALPRTMLLMGAGLVLGIASGFLSGTWLGWRKSDRKSALVSAGTLILVATPEFLIALLLLLGPGLALGLFPVAGMRTLYGPTGAAGFFDLLHHLALPSLALAVGVGAVVARHQATAVHALRDAEFVRTARAKGLTEWQVLRHHVLRNALGPLLTLGGVLFPALFGGAVLIERIFAWPGMGRTMVEGVLARDYPLVAGGVLVGTLCVVAGTLLADLALAWSDPRRRALP